MSPSSFGLLAACPVIWSQCPPVWRMNLRWEGEMVLSGEKANQHPTVSTTGKAGTLALVEGHVNCFLDQPAVLLCHWFQKWVIDLLRRMVTVVAPPFIPGCDRRRWVTSVKVHHWTQLIGVGYGVCVGIRSWVLRLRSLVPKAEGPGTKVLFLLPKNKTNRWGKKGLFMAYTPMKAIPIWGI